MPPLKTEGIILRKYFLRETSYLLLVYTRDYGKIRGVIKGVRCPYPQFSGNFEIFSCCEIRFYKKKKKVMDLIDRCDLKKYFLNARKDIERLTYANYFIELIDKVTCDYETNTNLYNIIYNGLELLASDEEPKKICRIFELKFLDAAGIQPGLQRCVKCGAEAVKDVLFSAGNGGVLCRSCAKYDRGSYSMSMGAYNFLKKIQSSSFERSMKINASKEVGAEIEKIINGFVDHHIGMRLKSRDFLDQIRKKGIVRV